MKRQLEDILVKEGITSIDGSTALTIDQLVFDSRLAEKGSVFFAVQGTATDGHNYIPQVIEAGCTCIVVQRQVDVQAGVTVIYTHNSAELLARMADRFYSSPSKQLKLIGVTGTNGKTTTTTLLFNVFRAMGKSCGLLSTVVNKINDREIPSTHTTPDPVSLNALLAEMVAEGCTHCFMEVSSHAVDQHRVTGLHFTGGVFTNITHDHLDYHKTFANYIKAKKGFFDMLPKHAFALVNADDKNGSVMLQNSSAERHTYALRSPADYRAKVIENQFSGLVLQLDGVEVWTKLIGDFNAYNLLAVYGVCRLLGEDQTEVLTAISNLDSVEGRFQYLNSDTGITAIVDYAHTPDALENVLKTIQNIRKGSSSVITVVGCGGDRDKDKRPKMAAIAAVKSDQVILTSDNPRSEDPQDIIDQMMSGIELIDQARTLSIVDRKQAIKTAIALAKSGDIILIAGKGHEKYQEIKGVKHPFDDKALANELFHQLQK
jgi:UDP-N-acetylmuramoyl-L-alanyl-D-glutamate--2,6-diaminopimelate ligase